jgi:hypothetical protein
LAEEGECGGNERLEDQGEGDARGEVEAQRLRTLGRGEEDAQRSAGVEGGELVRGSDGAGRTESSKEGG